ncbi:DUF2029 domain-containing protein [Amnibacterium setariae]|uniref:DUF2029 domain-containing protein n=1 Tax=Amnibacterium setariae TaxID=2306585 RepID=A0A3A1TVK7_9MICO|nr:DUF2029 domain-containing protein [Amnibacterium setariae]RIX28272.1 DUF2029 domain-containing protein [Amnibacterium setariae]
MPPLAVSRRRRWPAVVVLLVVGAIGAIGRLHMLFDPSPLFYGTYDDGVHFSAALNLVHGNLLYRDVLFLQPPGVVVASAPFALLANLTGDATAFAIGRTVFALVGALNGVLVAVALRRWGPAAMLVGGTLYALSFAAAYDERTITLEVIGTTGILASLVLLDVASRRSARRWVLLAGVAAGVSIDFKIWYVVPFVVLALLAGRRIGWFVLGTAVAGIAGYVPFFAAAPSRMWGQVVLAQLGRPKSTGTPLDQRLGSMLGIASKDGTSGIPSLWGPELTPWLVGLVVVLALLALATPGARRFVALLVATGAVLLLSPSYFQHYAVLTAAPLALIGGVGTVWIADRVRRGRRIVLAVSVVAALLLAVSVDLRQVVERSNQKVAPLAALTAAADRIDGCIVTDDPTILILMNRLTPDLRDGCVFRSDPSGYGYVLTPPGGKAVFRPRNPVWQRSAMRYLRSADAYLLVRGDVFGLTPANRAIVRRDRELFRVDDLVIRSGGLTTRRG